MYFAPIVNELVFEHHALGQEEREAGAFVHHCKQAEFLAELAVVTLFGFLQHVDIFIQIRLFFKSGCIDALEHLVFFAAAPVCARNAHELDIFALARGFKVRTCAEIHKIALTIEANHGVFGQVANEFHLIGLILFLHEANSLLAGEFETLKRQVFGNYLCNFLFNLRKIFGAERNIRVKVVVEAVIDRRSDCKLDFRPKAFHGLCKDVCPGVAIGPFAAVVGKGEQLQCAVVVNGQCRIIKLAVKLCRKRCLAKARAYALCSGICIHAVFKPADGTVRESDVDHFKSPLYFDIISKISGVMFTAAVQAVFKLCCRKQKNRPEQKFKDGKQNTAVPP